MKNDNALDSYRIAGIGNDGAFIIPCHAQGSVLTVIASTGGGWDHVSVSLKNRCPKWEEMCYIKDLFFNEDETCVQFHPRKSNYVNKHPYCLHIWRKQDVVYDLPPDMFV